MTIEDQLGMPDGSTGGDDILNSLVGPDKKFKTLSDLAKGKVESDSFIAKISAENAALRALIQNSDDTKRSADVMSEILARVSQGTTTHQGKTNAGAEPQPNGGEGNQSQALTSRDVEVLFTNLRKKELEDANEARAIGSLTKTYGDTQKVDEFLTRRAAELNLDVATLKATARRSPNAFYSLVGIATNNNSPTQGSATPGRNTSAIPEVARFGTEAARDKRYYERLKAEMGTKKFMLDKSLQIQLHKDMMNLGERWEQEA